MSPAFNTRRRAEQFNDLVEHRSTPDSTTPAELVELLEVAGALRETPAAQPRPEFTADLRARLMAAAPEAMAAGAVADRLTVHTGGTALRPASRTRRERRLGVAISAFALVGATGATAVAAEGALPGDTLYPIKRIVEDVQTGVALDDDAKAERLLSQADTRLDEVAELTARGDQADHIRSALEDFSAQAGKASDLLMSRYQEDGDADSVAQVRSFAASSIADLDSLAPALPESVDEALATAVQTLFDIDQAAAQLCPACTDAGITQVPSDLVDLVADTLGRTIGTRGLASVLVPAADDKGTARDERTKPRAKPTAEASAGSDPSSGGAAESAEPEPDPTLSLLPKPVKSGKPSPKPTSVGGVVSGVTDGLGSTLGGVGDTVGGDVGGLVGGLGDTVDQVGKGLGDTVDGVTGGLLGGLTGGGKTKGPK